MYANKEKLQARYRRRSARLRNVFLQLTFALVSQTRIASMVQVTDTQQFLLQRVKDWTREVLAHAKACTGSIIFLSSLDMLSLEFLSALTVLFGTPSLTRT